MLKQPTSAKLGIVGSCGHVYHVQCLSNIQQIEGCNTSHDHQRSCPACSSVGQGSTSTFHPVKQSQEEGACQTCGFGIENGDMCLCLKTLNGDMINVFGSLSTDISSLKTLYYYLSKCVIRPSMQRWIYAGKQLEDSCSLAHYKIREGATIQLVLRLRGD